MQEETTWILVANASVARIWEAATRETLEEVVSWAHQEGKLVEAGKHPSMEGSHAERQEEMELFARLLSKELDRYQRDKGYTKLYIAAGPRFLGILRKEFSHQVAGIVAGEIAKDLTHETGDKVRKHLPLLF